MKLPIERFDAEEWLQENKDIWNHPVITDRTEKNGYEVADLMADFATHVVKLLATPAVSDRGEQLFCPDCKSKNVAKWSDGESTCFDCKKHWEG